MPAGRALFTLHLEGAECTGDINMITSYARIPGGLMRAVITHDGKRVCGTTVRCSNSGEPGVQCVGRL